MGASHPAGQVEPPWHVVGPQLTSHEHDDWHSMGARHELWPVHVTAHEPPPQVTSPRQAFMPMHRISHDDACSQWTAC